MLKTTNLIGPRARRATLTWRQKGSAVALAAGVMLGVYACGVEPSWVEVSHHPVAAPLARKLRVAQLSDLHTKGFGSRERRVVELLRTEAPDVIVLTGDMVADDGTYDQVKETLKELHAPLGVWLVRGNWEHWRPSPDADRLYAAAGVHDLTNASTRLRDDLWLVGLDDALAGHPDEKRAFEGVPDGANVIVLLHSPAGAHRVKRRASLVLAGHTHGGQLQLPWGTPLWLPPGSGEFVEGTYVVNGTTMYVSRGIGSSIVDARLFCRPEIAVFDVGP